MGADYQVYFEGEYSYRAKRNLLAGLIAIGLGSALGAIVVSRVLESSNMVLNLLIALVALTITCVMSCAGVWLIWAWVTNKRFSVEVSTDGICYGKRFRKWSEIKRFGYYDESGAQFFYQTFRAGVDRQLYVSKRVSIEDAREVMKAVERDLSPYYGALKVGERKEVLRDRG